MIYTEGSVTVSDLSWSHKPYLGEYTRYFAVKVEIAATFAAVTQKKFVALLDLYINMYFT
jgi:hypothetical protein